MFMKSFVEYENDTKYNIPSEMHLTNDIKYVWDLCYATCMICEIFQQKFIQRSATHKIIGWCFVFFYCFHSHFSFML